MKSLAIRLQAVPLGIILAAAALAVTVPRYVLAFLAADRVEPHPLVEASLVILSAVATAIIITAGAAYVAHVLSTSSAHWIRRGLLFVLWLPLLGFEVALLAPAMLATMRDVPLACATSGALASASSAPAALCVLSSGALDALWSVVATAAPPVTALACVYAASLANARPQTALAPALSAPAVPLLPATDSAAWAPHPAPAPFAPSHKCERCQRTFGTANALIAHGRHCKGEPSSH